MSPHTFNPGEYTLPGGGLEANEDFADALVREVREETGLVVEIDGIADAHTEVFDGVIGRCRAVRVIYWVRIVGGELRCEVNGSTDDCRFYPLSELPMLPVVPLVWRGADQVRKRNELDGGSQ